MAIKSYKPITPSRRAMINVCYDKITTNVPYKRLIKKLKKTGGRNNQGLITVRHIGGGNKKKYRVIDFKRNKDGVIGTITTIEYDPNRNANICLVNYKDGEKRYILMPKEIKIGDQIISGENVSIKNGNTMPILNIPDGSFIHNIELKVGNGGQLCRSAGTNAQLLGKDGKYAIVRLASGEVRKIISKCRATIGVVGNEDYILINKGKAGKNRWLGIRPTVRGSAMNPVDHPHGGGEGKCPIGRDAPRTIWGKRFLGVKTRKHKKKSNKLIIKRCKK